MLCVVGGLEAKTTSDKFGSFPGFPVQTFRRLLLERFFSKVNAVASLASLLLKVSNRESEIPDATPVYTQVFF